MSTGLNERQAIRPDRLPVAEDGLPVWRHAVELGPVFTGAVFAVGALTHEFRVPMVLDITIAAAVMVAAVLVSVMMTRSAQMMWWGIFAGVAAAGWACYAAIAGAFSAVAFGTLVIPALLLVAAWPAIHAREERTLAAERRRLAAISKAEEAKLWPDILARIGAKGIRFVQREDIRNGYKVLLRLPDSGKVTYDTLASPQSIRKLEVAARARRGSLRFEESSDEADKAHEVWLHVSTIDVLAEIVPFPIPTQARSINDPIPVGLFEDGNVCYMTLREICVLIVGVRGSGKSNLINVLIANLAFCVDAIIFVIDQKSGRMAAPWVQPWIDAQTPGHPATRRNVPRPVVGWVAATPEETDLLVDACQRGATARDKARRGGEKTTPSIGDPAVIAFCDEAAIAIGQGMGGNAVGDGPTNYQLSQKMKRMAVLNRAAAIDLVMATQRGTVTMTGDGDLKSQCDLRIGLGVASESDARLIIPDNVPVAAVLSRLKHKGTGVVYDKTSNRLAPVKFYRITEDQIREVCYRAAALRPAPDKLLHEAFGHEYDERWTRSTVFTYPSDMPDPDDVEAQAARIDDEWEQMNAAGITPEDALSPGHKRMRLYMQRQGALGVTVGGVLALLKAERLEVSRQTVHRWLNDDEKKRLVEHREPRWFWTGAS